MALELNEARSIIEDIENVSQGNVFNNIYKIFQGKNKKDVKNFIYRLDINIEKEIEDYAKTIDIFNKYSIYTNDYKIKLRHKLRSKCEDLKVRINTEHVIDLINRTYMLNEESIRFDKPVYVNPIEKHESLYKVYLYLLDVDGLGIKDRLKLIKITGDVSFIYKRKKQIINFFNNMEIEIKNSIEQYNKDVKAYNDLLKWDLEYGDIIRKDLETLRDTLNSLGFKEFSVEEH